jgi:hypothetical protein
MSAPTDFSTSGPFRGTPASENLTALGREQSPLKVRRTESNTPSLLSMTPIPLHGNCPHCHHWHNKVLLRMPIPQIYGRVQCQNCSKHWFSLGGNSTHTSLLSQETKLSDTDNAASSSIAYLLCTTGTSFGTVAAPDPLTAVSEDQRDRSRNATPSEKDSPNNLHTSAQPTGIWQPVKNEPSSNTTDWPQMGQKARPNDSTPDKPSKQRYPKKSRLNKVFARLGFEVVSSQYPQMPMNVLTNQWPS